MLKNINKKFVIMLMVLTLVTIDKQFSIERIGTGFPEYELMNLGQNILNFNYHKVREFTLTFERNRTMALRFINEPYGIPDINLTAQNFIPNILHYSYKLINFIEETRGNRIFLNFNNQYEDTIINLYVQLTNNEISFRNVNFIEACRVVNDSFEFLVHIESDLGQIITFLSN